MKTRTEHTTTEMAEDKLRQALDLLAFRLGENGVEEIVELVVCGGSALILTGLVPRTTQDVDVVAFMQNGALVSPAPLPRYLVEAAAEVAEELFLPANWLNNGPSSGEGGLFQMGLPEGFEDRLQLQKFGDLLTVHFIGRLDQIHFKLYASVDQGGYHITDLQSLSPTPEEILLAAKWAITQDVSEEFRLLLKELIKGLGYENIVAKF